MTARSCCLRRLAQARSNQPTWGRSGSPDSSTIPIRPFANPPGSCWSAAITRKGSGRANFGFGPRVEINNLTRQIRMLKSCEHRLVRRTGMRESLPTARLGNSRARTSMSYIRRFRMDIDLVSARLPQPVLPDGYRWLAWDSLLVNRHASVKYYSFRDEIDSRVFPCLGDFSGCKRLMQEIVRQDTFLADATWLITNEAAGWNDQADCATIQGLAHSGYLGAVQNGGVLPQYRGLGLGRALVLKSLHGFRSAGLHRVYLEVTGENIPAVELYRSIGFELVRTMYKAIEPETVQNY